MSGGRGGVGRGLGEKMIGQKLVITEAGDVCHAASFYCHVSMHGFYFHK